MVVSTHNDPMGCLTEKKVLDITPVSVVYPNKALLIAIGE